MPKLISILLTILVAGSAVGQHWEFEQVDTAPWGAGVKARWHPDGRLFLCYGNDSGNIRLSWKDSVWHYEDLPGQIQRFWPEFEIGPHGELGVIFNDTAGGLWAGLRPDTLWYLHRLPIEGWFNGQITFDSSGSAVVLCGERSFDIRAVVLDCRLTDTIWTIDTVAVRDHGIGSCSNDAIELMLGSANTLIGSYSHFWQLLGADGRPIFTDDWYRLEWSEGVWARSHIAGVSNGALTGLAQALYPNGSSSYCFSIWQDWPPRDGFYFEDERIDTATVPVTALEIDSASRPMIASKLNWQTRELWFRYRDSSWHAVQVGPTDVGHFDLVIDSSGEPLIAYSRNGVWLAKGIDITSVEEKRPSVRVELPTSTIARGSLFLPHTPGPSTPWALFSITGRKVTDLESGHNDVRHVAPGVYFVREDSRVRKTVIQR